MYINILKKDLSRKRTMNIILFLFIILAATFVSSSVNNLMSISNAMEGYVEKSGIADYSIIGFEQSNEKTHEFVETNENVKNYVFSKNAMLAAENCELKGVKFNYSNTMVLSSVNEAKVKLFDEDNNEIEPLNDGEIMLTAEMKILLNLKIGDIITIHNGEFSRNYKYVGCTKDIIFSSSMAGITRLIVSENDYMDIMENGGFSNMYTYGVETDNLEKVESDFGKTGIPTMITLTTSQIKMIYVMDMVIAGAMLIVSVCLILISVVILRFTIVFTLKEEFREIGVMKAIGINNKKIRGIYIVKYLAISVLGSVIGFFVGIPFGELMIKDASKNIVIDGTNNLFVNLVCCIAVVLVVVMFCYLSTRMVKKTSPIDAIRNGSNGERFKRKSVLNLNKTKMPSVIFMAINDILSGLRRFGVLILTFTIGLLLILIPITTINTLKSDSLVNWFGMSESDVYISEEMMFSDGSSRQDVYDEIEEVENLIKREGINAIVFKEVVFKFSISYGENSFNSISTQGTGIGTDAYIFTDGTPMQNENEVAITHIIAEKIGAKIGDTVKISLGDRDKEFIVTALYQSMNNMGEGIKFHPDLELDYSNAMGQFATQVKYIDNPTQKEISERFDKIKELFPDKQVYTGGEYVSDMMGDVAGSMSGIKNLIIIVVLSINILVSVLMVKSFIAKETGEIGMLKAIGFRNSSIRLWQTTRIGIVLIISIIIGILLEKPLGQISTGAVFRMMGASSIEFKTNILEEYVAYPLIVLIVTLLSSYIASGKVKRISASETSNIE